MLHKVSKKMSQPLALRATKGHSVMGRIVYGQRPSNAARPREAELTARREGKSEGFGACNAPLELLTEDGTMVLVVGASASKGVLLRTDTGRMKHLSTTHLWLSGAIQ